jgi:hemolysin-activating ACP:hemolysin acyltransferase
MSMAGQNAGFDTTRPPTTGVAATEPDVSAQDQAGGPFSRSPGAADGSGSGLTTAAIRRQAAALRRSLAFTQVVGVLMRSPHYKEFTLGDLEWLVVPPLLAGQYRIGEIKPNDQGASLPVAVVLWACVSADVDKRLTEADTLSIRLQPDEWTSGDIVWLVHAAGETRFVRHVVKELRETTLKGRELKVFGRDQDGKPKIHLLAETPQSA